MQLICRAQSFSLWTVSLTGVVEADPTYASCATTLSVGGIRDQAPIFIYINLLNIKPYLPYLLFLNYFHIFTVISFYLPIFNFTYLYIFYSYLESLCVCLITNNLLYILKVYTYIEDIIHHSLFSLSFIIQSVYPVSSAIQSIQRQCTGSPVPG